MMNDIITSLFLGVLDHLHVVLQAGLVGRLLPYSFVVGYLYAGSGRPALAPPATILSGQSTGRRLVQDSDSFN